MSVILKKTMKSLLSSNPAFRLSAVRGFPAPRKRFYKNVHVTENDGKFEIYLDKRKLKTPLGNVLQLQNEGLAVAVATEWDTQGEILQLHNMHITSLCNTATDNPTRQTKESLADSTLQYLSSDTLCFRSTEPPDLVDFQNEKWNPWLDWFYSRYKVKTNICENVSCRIVSEEGLEEIRKQLMSYNDWCLIGINFAAENLKSLVLTFALINHASDVEKVVDLSRLETIFQINRWGNVEWAHDLERAQTTSRVSAAALFVYLNEGWSSYEEKPRMKRDTPLKVEVKQ